MCLIKVLHVISEKYMFVKRFGFVKYVYNIIVRFIPWSNNSFKPNVTKMFD